MSQNFIYSLEIMGKGMLAIFTVILLLTFIVMLLAFVAKVSDKRKNKKAQKEA
jgi:uncharacterized membrane protein